MRAVACYQTSMHSTRERIPCRTQDGKTVAGHDKEAGKKGERGQDKEG